LSKLLLVRHGETELNSSLRYWGKTDVPLGAAGIKQAECLRCRLAAEKIDHIYSSSLKRAMLTAQTIAAGRNLAVTGCDELREVDFGRIEGLTFAEIQVQFPQIARMWAERDPALAYPQGESLAQLDKRIAVFTALLARHGPDDTVLIVAHSGVLRTLICMLMEMEMRNRWKIRLDLASLSIIDTYPQTAILCLLNDTSHLKVPSTT
jgi:alpha-ribazole phosphatase